MTFEVHYTKNILDGPLAGLQLASCVRRLGASEACRVSSRLNTGGIMTDAITKAPWTAHNINIQNSEDDLAALLEPVDFEPVVDDDLAELLERMGN